MQQILLKNCKQLLTMESDCQSLIGLKECMSVLIENEKIKKIDKFQNLSEDIQKDCNIIDCSSKVVMPGYVDAHTHLIFGKSRVEEYCLGFTKTSQDIKKILPRTGLALSMYYTKNASDEELITSSMEKLNRMLKNGTTTIEIKSGYGIDKNTELKQLRLIKKLKDTSKQTIFSTYLGAHYWDTNMGKQKYIEFMIKEVMPIIKDENLAQFSDVWCDDGYYTAEESETILETAKKYGMIPTLHTECYSAIGGARVAAKVKAANAGHLNYLSLEDAKLMSKAGVVGILIPTTDFSVRHPKPFNIEILRNANMKMAIATNLNPGNWAESMAFSMQLACRNHSISTEEAIYSATMGGAQALRIEDMYGSIKEGKYADIQIINTDDYRDIVYKLAVNLVETVIKTGSIVI